MLGSSPMRTPSGVILRFRKLEGEYHYMGGLGMPQGPASNARGESRRVSAPWEAGFAGAGGTGLWARYPFSDPQSCRASFSQRNFRLETERNSLPNENTVSISLLPIICT